MAAGESKTVSFQATAGEAESFSSLAAVTVDNVRYTTNTVTSTLVEKSAVQVEDEAFASLEEALTAAVSGNTVTLLDDVSAGDVILSNGVNLDLNGFTLTADSVLTYSSSAIIDTSENVSGLLKINDEYGNMISKDNVQLPVYDNATDAGGYRFFAIDVDSCAFTGKKSGEPKYWFRIKAEKFAPLYELICADSEIVIKVKLTWDGQEDSTYAVADMSFTKMWADHYNANNDIYITVTATDIEGLENLKLIPVITSGGVEISGEEM